MRGDINPSYQCPYCDTKQKIGYLKRHVELKHSMQYATTDFSKLMPINDEGTNQFPEQRQSFDPRFGLGDPRAGLGDPRAGLGDPRVGMENLRTGWEPSKFGLGDPRAGFENPRTGWDSSRAGLEHPRAGLEPPRAGLEHPRTGLEPPGFGSEHPRQVEMNQPQGVDFSNNAYPINNASTNNTSVMEDAPLDFSKSANPTPLNNAINMSNEQNILMEDTAPLDLSAPLDFRYEYFAKN